MSFSQTTTIYKLEHTQLPFQKARTKLSIVDWSGAVLASDDAILEISAIVIFLKKR
jgi:hypothetical protein